MLTSAARILTTHTGSLPRPAALTAMYARRVETGVVDEAALTAVGQAATRHVVRRRMSGFGGSWTRRPMADMTRYPGFSAWAAEQEGMRPSVSNRGALPKAIGAVTYLDPALVRAECEDFQATMHEVGRFAEPFMTAPSPGIIAAALLNAHYDTEDAYLAALGQALRVEYEAIHAAGFLLQIDAPDLALERHVSFQDRPLGDFLDFAERVVATINDALVNVPRNRVRIHACWGNYEAPHDCDVDLHDILPTISKAKVGGWVLPFANPRHAHEYRCLKDLPLDDGQVVVAGVIDPLTNFVEHPEVVADRLERVAQVLGNPSRVIAGTDCGFDTSAGRGRVAVDVVWAKLRAMADGARIASERLGMPG
jgi:5-methyltetrahydropteroyltriglutamate--homocysteine methyltransferase